MSERRTSAAKDILSPREQSMLETYGVARNHFEHSRDPTISQQHIDLARQEAMEKAKEERGGILANGGDRLPEFNSRANDNSRQAGSSMVQNDRPEHNMRPPEEMARPVDRESFEKRWHEERAAAAEPERQLDRER